MGSVAVRYPDFTVRLVGEDGNAFAILGRVRRALLLVVAILHVSNSPWLSPL